MRAGELILDETMLELLGLDPATFDGRPETGADHIHPDDLPNVLAAADDAMRRGAQYRIEYRVKRPDGTLSWVCDSGYATVDASGQPLELSGSVRDATESRISEETAGRALRNMSDGFLAVGPDWRITFANAQAERMLGARRRLLGSDLWDALAYVGVPGLEERLRDATATGRVDDFEFQAADGRWHHVRLLPSGEGLTMYLSDVTERRARDAERAAAERSMALSEFTRALGDALTVRDVVNVVAERVLPPFGASGMLIISSERNRLRILGAKGYSPEYFERTPTIPLRGAVAQALEDRVPQFISSVREYIERYPHLSYMPAVGGKQAWAFLPLIASGHTFGCCLISFDEPREFTREERDVLVTVSGFVAQALERARLYDAEHARAQQLQRGLLPQSLPTLPAASVAVRYLPATKEMEVGGDWYDVIPLSAERVALVIGDVMGHGVAEAATMGRLRTAVRTLTDLEMPPEELLVHLNDLVNDLGDDFFATCLYMVYDPITRRCVFSQAGHPPPAIVHPDGSVHFPEMEPDPPLGAAAPPFAVGELELPADSLLVLYTDGLVESDTLDIDQGMAALARALNTVTKRTPKPPRRSGRSAKDRDDVVYLESLCDALVGSLLPSHEATMDDAALLMARTGVLPKDHIATWPLPEDPVAAGEAREYVAAKLSDWGLDSLTMTTELLASELVGNVIRHAKGPITLRLIRGKVLTCEVTDGSLTTPRIRKTSVTDEGGRGLQLVAALSQRWGTRYTTDGKCIWTEQPLPSH